MRLGRVSYLFAIMLAVSAARAKAGGSPISITPEAVDVLQTFRFDASGVKPSPKSVHLAGTFNHFSHEETPMNDLGGGIYSVTLQLSPGLYHYKFLVDEDRWFTDPSADKKLEDAEDHHNSGVVVGVDGRKLPPPAPNAIEPRGLAHNSADEMDANVASSSLLRLRVRTQADDVQQVIAWYRGDTQWDWQHQELGPIDTDLGFEYFGGLLSVDGSKTDYFFELVHGTARKYLAAGILYSDKNAAMDSSYVKSMHPTFATPEWAMRAVWYQIFVERFRNGETNNDPPNATRWQSKWYAILPGETPGAENLNKDISRRRYGGDLQGVRTELPYLRQLGVTALYLNPIFEADSSHKYDTRDYRHVDDGFGVAGSVSKLVGETDDPVTWKWSDSDKVFLDLVREAHRQGFKIIIDGVFNHASWNSPYFQDVLKKGRASKYADWFEILDWGKGGKPGQAGGLQWASWNGRNGVMVLWKKDPNLGLVHGPRELMLAIARRWLAPDGDISAGVDGFRLDAADRVPHPFWVDWRQTVKSINPQAYISGEIWGWAQPWLEGDQFDAVMNYQFAAATQGFFVDQKNSLMPTQFDGRLKALLYNYPLQVVLAQQNLLDSHDTDRFVSRFASPDKGFKGADRAQPGAMDWIRDRQAVAFQMTFAGAPMIYYGDEAGMWGPTDPSDRMPMWWKDAEPFDEPSYKFNSEQFEFYQRMIAIRRGLAELQNGSFRLLVMDDARSVYAFVRELDHKTVCIVLNRSDVPVKVRVSVTTDSVVDWMDIAQMEMASGDLDRPSIRPRATARGLAAKDGVVQVELAAYGTAVLAPLEQR